MREYLIIKIPTAHFFTLWAKKHEEGRGCVAVTMN